MFYLCRYNFAISIPDLICGILYSCKKLFLNLMSCVKCFWKNTVAEFYVCKRIILTNVAKIKCLCVKDCLLYSIGTDWIIGIYYFMISNLHHKSEHKCEKLVSNPVHKKMSWFSIKWSGGCFLARLHFKVLGFQSVLICSCILTLSY